MQNWEGKSKQWSSNSTEPTNNTLVNRACANAEMMTEGNVLSEMLIIKEVIIKEGVSVNFYVFLDVLSLRAKNYINL